MNLDLDCTNEEPSNSFNKYNMPSFSTFDNKSPITTK